jgi:glycosyltransferase involved in cell wall biosynthesis
LENVKILSIASTSLAFRGLVNGQIKYIKNYGYDIKMVSNLDGPVNDIVQAEGVEHITIHVNRAFAPIADLKALYQFYKLFKKEKPLIIHSQSIKANLLAMLAGKLANVPIRIQTMAGLISTMDNSLKSKMYRQVEMLTFKFSTNVWPNSLSSYNYMVKTKMCPKNKMNVIGYGSSNGVNINNFSKNLIPQIEIEEVKKNLNFNSSNFYYLFLGRIVRDKGIADAVKAFVLLQKKHKNIKLIVAGMYDEKATQLDNETLVELKNNKAIHFVGKVKSVNPYFAVANSFLFPSYREGFPTVLLEAGALKCPIICSNIIGNIDMIRDKETGVVFEVKNISQIESAMEYALQNTKITINMANTFYEEIIQKFSQEYVCQKVAKAYDQLVENYYAKKVFNNH